MIAKDIFKITFLAKQAYTMFIVMLIFSQQIVCLLGLNYFWFSVSKLPLYTFKIDREHPIEDGDVNVNSSEELPQVFFLHNLLLGEWEDRMRRGLFRYDVTNCETKVIPGKYGFIAQLNEGRHLKKRLTEFPVDQVLQLSNRLCPDVGCGRTTRMANPVRNGVAEIVRHCGDGGRLLTRRQIAEVEPVVRM